jgi:hypothetical protein
LSADWLVKVGLFGTVPAARQAVARLVEKRLHQPFKNTLIWQVSPFPRLVIFRRQKQRGRDSMALISYDVLNPGDLLAQHVGELRIFDGDEVQPEPGAYEPGTDAPADSPAEQPTAAPEQIDPAAFEPDEPAIMNAMEQDQEAGQDAEESIAEAIQIMRAIAAAHARRPILGAWGGGGGGGGLSFGAEVTRALEEYDKLQPAW